MVLKRPLCYRRAPLRFFFNPLVRTADLLIRATNSSTVSSFFSRLVSDLAMMAFPLDLMPRNESMPR